MNACDAIKIVITTHDDLFAARELAQKAVEARLAACINIIPNIVSVFRWQKAVQTEDEVLLICKTTEDILPRLKEFLTHEHSYEVPEMLELDAGVLNESYSDWLHSCLEV